MHLLNLKLSLYVFNLNFIFLHTLSWCLLREIIAIYMLRYFIQSDTINLTIFLIFLFWFHYIVVEKLPIPVRDVTKG